MVNLVVVLLFSIAIHIGDCFNGQIRDNYGDVNDILANHPVIKQLISRVDILEEKDRLNSEQIVKLTAQLGQCREDIDALQEKKPEVSEWKDGWNTSQNISDSHDGKQTTEQRTVSLYAERNGELRSIKQGKAQQRIRQVPAEGTVAFFTTRTPRDQNLSPNQNIIFDNVVTNIGNGYNLHQGVFVAPVAGTYVFFSTVLANNDGEVWVHIAVNAKYMASFYARGTDGRHDSGSQMIVVTLNQGDDVSVQSNSAPESVYGQSYTTFSGYLLSNTVTNEVIG